MPLIRTRPFQFVWLYLTHVGISEPMAQAQAYTAGTQVSHDQMHSQDEFLSYLPLAG